MPVTKDNIEIYKKWYNIAQTDPDRINNSANKDRLLRSVDIYQAYLDSVNQARQDSVLRSEQNFNETMGVVSKPAEPEIPAAPQVTVEDIVPQPTVTEQVISEKPGIEPTSRELLGQITGGISERLIPKAKADGEEPQITRKLPDDPLIESKLEALKAGKMFDKHVAFDIGGKIRSFLTDQPLSVLAPAEEDPKFQRQLKEIGVAALSSLGGFVDFPVEFAQDPLKVGGELIKAYPETFNRFTMAMWGNKEQREKAQQEIADDPLGLPFLVVLGKAGVKKTEGLLKDIKKSSPEVFENRMAEIEAKGLKTSLELPEEGKLPKEKVPSPGEAKIIGEKPKPGKVESLKGDRERITDEITSLANTMKALKKSGVEKTEIFDNLQKQIDAKVNELNTKIAVPEIEVKKVVKPKEKIITEVKKPIKDKPVKKEPVKKTVPASEAKGEQGVVAKNLSQQLANLFGNLNAIESKTGVFKDMPVSRLTDQKVLVRDLIKKTQKEAKDQGIELPMSLGIPTPQMLRTMGKFWQEIFKGRKILSQKEIGTLKTALETSEGKRLKEELDYKGFSDKQRERNWQTSKKIDPDPLMTRVRDKFVSIKNKATREFENIKPGKESAELLFALRKLKGGKGISAHKTLVKINEIVKGLDEKTYDLFSRKVVLDDLIEFIPESGEIPFGFKKAELIKEHNKITAVIEASPELSSKLKARKKVWKELKEEYISAMEGIGFNVRKRLKREDYFHRIVLDHAELNAIYGTGKKLKTPTGRGFLKKRTGSEKNILSDYIKAEFSVMSQMMYDIEVAKTLKKVDRHYNIAGKLRKEGKEKGIENWRELIPEGYVEWQPRDGNVFYMTDAIPGKIAQELLTGKMEEIGITKKDIKKVFK